MKKAVLGTSLLFFILFVCSVSQAQDIGLPTAYSPQELAKVRDWEKTWAGEKIDKTNIDQVAAFMPESYVGLYKNPETWGAPAEGLYFHIAPYREIQETKNFIMATQKYAPRCRLNENGVLENISEVAGRPFPQPKNGLEVAWNFELNNKGDSAQYRKFAPNINPRSKTERSADQEVWEFTS